RALSGGHEHERRARGRGDHAHCRGDRPRARTLRGGARARRAGAGDGRDAMSRARVPLVIAALAAAILAIGALLRSRSAAGPNQVALSSSAKGVTVIAVKDARYRPSRAYIGTIEPWVQAKVGPELVSAYVDTVLFRPGAVIKRGEVLATLDCRNASAAA